MAGLNDARFLEEWAEGSVAKRSWKPNAIIQLERRRISESIATARIAKDVPRRLGADATDKELSYDKKLSRRIEFRLETILRWWGLGKAAGAKVPRSQAATVIWGDWWQDQAALVIQRGGVVAATALRHGNQELGNQMVHRYQRELEYLDTLFKE